MATSGVGSPRNLPHYRMLISRDAEVLFFLSSILRLYWSLSPPPVYTYEGVYAYYLTIFDLATSLALWSTILFIGWGRPRAVGVPARYQWPVLLLVGSVMAPVASCMVDHEDTAEGWPLAEVAIMLNMVLDTLGRECCWWGWIAITLWCQRYE